MSWIKRRGQVASPNPSSAPPVQMYNPNQHLQSQWQQQDLQTPSTNNWYNQTQPTQQQKPFPTTTNYNQPSQPSNYWQQPYNNQQLSSYNQNTNQYGQQYSQYNQPQATYYENNSYQQQQSYPTQQTNNPSYNYGSSSNHTEQRQTPSEADTWNWGWGDEDNSNVQTQISGNSNVNTNSVVTNTITDSFEADEAWNWSVEESSNTNATSDASNNKSSNESHGKTSSIISSDSYVTQNIQNVENKQDTAFTKMGKLAEKHNRSSDPLGQNLKDNNDQKTNLTSTSYSDNLSSNQLLGIASPKHSKSENLTPQWSTESQLSQDSSDLLHTSESDKSHMLSRSSTISESPVSGHDANADSFTANRQELLRNQQFDSYNNQAMAEVQGKMELTASGNYYKQENYNLQHENREVLSSVKEDLKSFKNNPTPPPMKTQTPPLNLPPTSAGDDLKNPYKRTAGLSHKSASKYKSDNHQQGYLGPNQYNYPVSSSPFNQFVNLETLPDNSEQPDSLPQQNQLRKISSTKAPVQQWSENNEIAPINDRNQYLETGQLSNNDFVQSDHSNQIESSDAFPPPGFTRMVLGGQMEQSDSNAGNQDEPPPGLSRMVLGQTESGFTSLRSDANELPVGLHRMIPGESSSPEVFAVRESRSFQMPSYGDGDASEPESNQLVGNQVRSATIGADTPPVTGNVASGTSTNVTANRSEAIGADLALPYSSLTTSDNKKSNSQVSSASSNYNSNIRETNADGANKLDENVTNPPTNNRRDSIEGQPQDGSSAISNLVNSVRDLKIGENSLDGANSSLSLAERSTRRSSRQESTDSEQEYENRNKVAKDKKERRYIDKPEQYEREKGRGRYSPSPEQYRDKKHDRRRYRDKRYDDDTDYYSDKERDRRRDDRDRKEDLDRKYSSLKKDKEKERRRREHRNRDYGRDGRRGDYYSRYEEYDDPSRSRPSSRSDSMHESYRQDRDRHRERDRHRRHRDPFNPYLQGYSYDPYSPYYQQYQYQYYENLRRTNPQAYAEWYRKYYQQSGAHQGYGNEDRASVHSGRSSANDELAKDRPFDQTDSSLYLDETTVASQRLTPAKFATAHIKASISSGRLVKVFPHYPLDGQTATIEVSNLHELLNSDDEYKELIEFPGPLVKGITHKKTIIEYCENKIRNAICSRDIVDVDSYILMWELLILLLRQNGMVVGTDIAELLMKDRKHQNSRRASVISNSSSVVAEPSEASNIPASETNSSSMSILKEEIVTNKFRDYLIYGSEKEALEWAMKHGLWGHALFLASKLDKRTYANVMTRFANGLPMNDPLQTLYQLLSGKVPSAVTSVADEKWGDWRPHLAMILSNTTQRPELDRKAITTLADTLINRGSLYAAQFCYLMAQVGFSRYGSDGAKLVLLGSNHNKKFLEFAVNEAIHMTEVYEYACSLNDAGFLIPEFQAYKYLLATRLADRGLLEKSLAYLEKVSLAILQNPSSAQPSLITQVCELADRLKYCDPIESHLEGDGDLDISHPDNSWLKELKALEKDYSMGLIAPETTENYSTHTPEMDPSQPTQLYDQTTQEPWQQQYVDQQNYQQRWQTSQYTEPQADYSLHSQSTQLQDVYGSSDQYQQEQQYWNNQQHWDESQPPSNNNVDTNKLPENVEQHSSNDYWNNVHTQDVPRPTITMPNQSKENSTFSTEQDNKATTEAKKESPIKPKPKQEKPATTGWFGGIWNKLSLRPKNQMKLPDDKNPTIVWDETKKRWVNLDAEAEGTVTELKPPPKMSDMFPNKQQAANVVQEQSNFSSQTQSLNPQSQGFNSQPHSLNLQTQGLNSQPHSLNSQPQILNSQPHSLNSQPHSLNSQPHSLNSQISNYNQPLSFNASHQDGSHQNTNAQLASSGISSQNSATQRSQLAVSNNNNNNEEPMSQSKSNQPNIFKLQRNRNIKKAYVDVFNPGAKSMNTGSLPAPDTFSSVPSNNGPQMNFFIPAPINDPNAPTDFLTPASIQHPDDNQQLQPQ